MCSTLSAFMPYVDWIRCISIFYVQCVYVYFEHHRCCSRSPTTIQFLVLSLYFGAMLLLLLLNFFSRLVAFFFHLKVNKSIFCVVFIEFQHDYNLLVIDCLATQFHVAYSILFVFFSLSLSRFTFSIKKE